MASNRYQELVELIDDCKNAGHLSTIRALIQGYRLQKGGFSPALKVEIDQLHELVTKREKEINQLER